MIRCIYFVVMSLVLAFMIRYSPKTLDVSANKDISTIESVDEIINDEFSIIEYIFDGDYDASVDENLLTKSECVRIYRKMFSGKSFYFDITPEIYIFSDENVTMAEFSQIMSPFFVNETKINNVEYITDVYETHSFYENALKLYETGIYIGDEHGAFKADSYVTYGTAKRIIERILDNSLCCTYEPAPKTTQTKLDVNCILQNPELPTGCEVTSLAIALNYLGFGVDKCFLADNYLDMCAYGQASPFDAFVGTPYYDFSYGCFSPVIERCANKYLNDNNSSLEAYDISGSSVERLFVELEQGFPVIVWATMYMMETEWVKCWEINGEDIYFPVNEHCLVLTGFDYESNSVYVADPLKGNVRYRMDLFKSRYEKLLKQAVVIK